jgi:hypothetical protein
LGVNCARLRWGFTPILETGSGPLLERNIVLTIRYYEGLSSHREVPPNGDLVQQLTKRSIDSVGHYLRSFFVRVNAVALIKRFDSRYAGQKKWDQMNLMLASE